MWCKTLIPFPQMSNLRVKKLYCMCLRTMKQWSRWSLKGRGPTMRHVSRTHTVALDWFFRSNQFWIPRFKASMSTQNTNLQTYWQKGISHVMSGTIFFIFSTTAISAYSAPLRISVWPAALKRWRKGCKNRKERNRIVAKSKPTMNLVSPVLDKFFDSAESGCVEKPGDTQSTLSNRLVKYWETWRERTQSRRSVEFSRMAKRCISWCRYDKTRRDRRRPGTPELSWRFSKYEENSSLQETQKPKAATKVGHTITTCQQITCCTWRKVSSIVRPRYGLSPTDVRCEHSSMGFFWCLSSCSSSW